MKRLTICCGALALAVWALVQAPGSPRALADAFPPGALLYLQARDFGSLLKDWNSSVEKQRWLASDNYQVFSRSRLFLRLGEARDEFAAAAGLPPDMALLDSIAGSESALALYDIGQLQFLYITRLPSARALQSVLWNMRSSYETRSSAGQAYFVRSDPASRRVAAFASAHGYLLLATREDLMAGALALLAGGPGLKITGEQWYADAVRAAAAPGDLRLVMNLAALARSPYFRSYWIQRNVAALRQYWTGIADVRRSAGAIREDRVFLRSGEAPPSAAADGALSKVLRLIPPGAGVYRAWAAPRVEDASAQLGTLLAPGPGAPIASEMAPAAQVYGAEVGFESDLETRIDEPPLAEAAKPLPGALAELFRGRTVDAMASVSSTRVVSGGVLVRVDSAVLLHSPAPWTPDAVRNTVAAADDWGPLGRLAYAVRGNVLIVSNSRGMLRAIEARGAAPGAPRAAGAYSAAFDAARERPNLIRMMRLLDYPSANAPNRSGPQFFSGNIASLGETLSRVESSSIVARDTGAALFETVAYKLGAMK